MTRPARDLTDGSIVRALMALATPIVLANLLHTAYQLTDTFWVGRLGTDAVAAVSLSFPVIFFLISLGLGLAVAGTVLVSQFQGAADLPAVNRVSAQTLVGVMGGALVLAACGFFNAAAIVSFLGASGAVLPLADEYLRVSFAGLPFLFAYLAFQSLMRGVGDATTPMIVVFGTVMLNFVLDPLFIFGYKIVPALGVSGAALATVVTQGLAAAVGLSMLFSGRYGIHLQLRNMRPEPRLLWRLLKLGVPASVEQSTRALGLILIMMLVATFGTTTLAAYGVGARILGFVIIPALGLAEATSALVGQNIGAGKIRRAEHTAHLSALVALAVLTGVGLGAFVFAEQIMAVFVPGAHDVIAQGVLFIRITAFMYGLIGIQLTMSGAFRGSGDTMTAMVLALISLWMLRFPLAWVLSTHTTLDEIGIWAAYPIQSLISAVVAWAWFARGAWKRRVLIKKAPDADEIRADTVINSNIR